MTAHPTGKTLPEIALSEIDLGAMGRRRWYSLPALEAHGVGRISRLPVSLRVVLESVLRHCDGRKITEAHIRDLASWGPDDPRETEVPFTVGRIVLNCAAGIPLLGDVTALRGAVARRGLPAGTIGPKVPVDMALDHTLTVDHHASPDAMRLNMALDIKRNRERYEFVKWAMQAYGGIRLFPPGAGILHQLNLEYLAPGLGDRDGVCFPDTLVGTDSHTCMIAGLGSVGWGVGGIEAQAALLGEPVFFLMPDVVGVNLSGALREGVTATDLVLHVTEMLRRAQVVGKFVEFFGEGVAALTLPDRATIANMAPEYGATIGYFPVDAQTCRYLAQTGRPAALVSAVETYFRAQGCFGAPMAGQIDYSETLALDLSSVTPNVAGPKRPQDRVPLADLKDRFTEALTVPVVRGGYGRPGAAASSPAPDPARRTPCDGDVLIAAITSCTNTSNPGLMLAAGLVARKARARGLTVKPWVKTSLTPGSTVVGRYFVATGLQADLDALGFAIAGYSCATCVGASGPIDGGLESAVTDGDIVACAVLSGNRNFEARIHPSVRAAYLASPPLVVAFAIAGTVRIALDTEPLAHDPDGAPVYLRDIWPTPAEIEKALGQASDPGFYHAAYAGDPAGDNPLWARIPQARGAFYPWAEDSTYLKEPPFLDARFSRSALREVEGARALAILGDSVTTDHISPIGTIRPDSPAGVHLAAQGVKPADFNNFGARRMNHEVMLRGAFSNPRLINRMVAGAEGGFTARQPGGEIMTIYDAAMAYEAEDVPLILFAGKEYGAGSARDWAAKGTRLLGVRAVVAEGFERIHRSNLIGMGVLPFQLKDGTVEDLALDGAESFDILGIDDDTGPRQEARLIIRRSDGRQEGIGVILRIDTAAELDYLRRGGLMPYILAGVIEKAGAE